MYEEITGAGIGVIMIYNHKKFQQYQNFIIINALTKKASGRVVEEIQVLFIELCYARYWILENWKKE